ncbi:S-protein homolog 31-like [Salvia miltiorrhiza]|uniref:S-protein homolog 31-like n=1 Tax=Salvia miltiorrhiza TaxID=226208 RepID=UPI0025ABDC3F|nr:S-protein homolog 31-like [Salvia miltiorrhiza]
MKAQNAVALFLISCTMYITLLTLKQHLSMAGRTYDVRIINGFTNNSSLALVVWCAAADGGDIGGRALQERDDYSWSVKVGPLWSSARFVCTLKWDAKRRKFDAFRASRDRYRCGHGGQCLWLVKEDGFYFSNDGATWIKNFAWM